MTPRTKNQSPPKGEQPDAPATDDPEHEGDEPDVTPEPEPEPGADPAEVQARKIDNAQRKYRKDLAGILGDLEGATDCPVCDGFGIVPAAQAFPQRSNVERCATCHGYGQETTGSLKPDQMFLPCEDCNGQGWRYRTPDNVHELPATPPTQLPLPAQQLHGWWDPATQTFHPYSETVQS